MPRLFLLTAACSGVLAVMLGAFGAHGLGNLLDSHRLSVYQTGVQYHFYHTLLLMGIGLLLQFYPGSRILKWSGGFAIAGILLFSGSLYVLALTGVRWLGIVTPVGGLAFVLSWLLVALGVYRGLES